MKCFTATICIILIAIIAYATTVENYNGKVINEHVERTGQYYLFSGTVTGPPCERVHVIADVMSEEGMNIQVGKDYIKITGNINTVDFTSKTPIVNKYINDKSDLEIYRIRDFCITE